MVMLYMSVCVCMCVCMCVCVALLPHTVVWYSQWSMSTSGCHVVCSRKRGSTHTWQQREGEGGKSLLQQQELNREIPPLAFECLVL